jgi:predicted nucleotide-binding protein
MAVPLLPKLLVSRSEAEAKIRAQIDRGLEITETLGSALSGPGVYLDMAVAQAEVEREKWAKFTIDLLSTLFVDLRTNEEFGWWRIIYNSNNEADQAGQLLQWTTGWLHSLESIIERLDLFPLAEKPVHAEVASAPSKKQSRDIFIVHGHDEAAKQEVARVIEKLELHAIILHEQPDKGRTIIEKFEHHSDVGFAVVLLTPDDMGYPKDTPSEVKPRARQNVVLELGYFIGILGRSNVCPLLKSDVEIPNDYAGVLYKKMDASGAWRFELAREIKAAGIDVDLNRLK